MENLKPRYPKRLSERLKQLTLSNKLIKEQNNDCVDIDDGDQDTCTCGLSVGITNYPTNIESPPSEGPQFTLTENSVTILWSGASVLNGPIFFGIWDISNPFIPPVMSTLTESSAGEGAYTFNIDCNDPNSWP